VWLAAVEDVILKKLDSFREGGSEKHARDVRGMLAQTPVDQAYVDEWVRTLGLQEAWQHVIDG
jgi:hypothetical protein